MCTCCPSGVVDKEAETPCETCTLPTYLVNYCSIEIFWHTVSANAVALDHVCVAVKKGSLVVGQVPRKNFSCCLLFLRTITITATVRGTAAVFQWLTPGWTQRLSPTLFHIWLFTCWSWRCDNKINFDAKKLVVYHLSLNTAAMPLSNCNGTWRKWHLH